MRFIHRLVMSAALLALPLSATAATAGAPRACCPDCKDCDNCPCCAKHKQPG